MAKKKARTCSMRLNIPDEIIEKILKPLAAKRKISLNKLVTLIDMAEGRPFRR